MFKYSDTIVNFSRQEYTVDMELTLKVLKIRPYFKKPVSEMTETEKEDEVIARLNGTSRPDKVFTFDYDFTSKVFYDTSYDQEK